MADLGEQRARRVDRPHGQPAGGARQLGDAGDDGGERRYAGGYGLQAWDYLINSEIRVKNAEPVWANVVTLNWDVFTGFDRLNALREARAQASAARADPAGTQLDVIAEVWRAYYDYRAAARKLEFAAALIAASQEACDANIKTYEHGLSNIVDLLTAERDLANARYTVVHTRAEMLVGAARVAYAAGTVEWSRGPAAPSATTASPP